VRRENPGGILAADLFCGAGGLSLGLAQAGINVVLGVDHYDAAVKTHAHHFPGLSVDWDLADADAIERVARLMGECHIEVLCGGPPCQPFSKAGRSKIRHRVRAGERDPHDQRRDLWRSFVEVVRLAKPKAVIMENVPDMALDPEMFIFRSIVQELEDEGYAVESRVVDTAEYGVPQFRQRLILVALADGRRFSWPKASAERVSLWNAIGDLPEVDAGWRKRNAMSYVGPPVTAFQRRMREGVADSEAAVVYDHMTRAVREDDAIAFDLMDSDTKYSDLPEELKRYRDDIFDDKYKRLDENDLSRTITAHIAKDGYWYIHPRQARTLTVREAARVQTFPDWYRFAGPPTAAFKQIGNAVPPALGRYLAEAVIKSLSEDRKKSISSSDIASLLAAWFDSSPSLSMPWLKASARWQVLLAHMLLVRCTPSQIRDAWPIIATWKTPSDTCEQSDILQSLGGVLGRAASARRIGVIATELVRQHDVLLSDDKIVAVHGLSRAAAELAVLAVPPEDEVRGEQPVVATQPALRVAARFIGQPVDQRNRLTDGRMAIARMIGAGGPSRSAQLAIIEIGNAICHPSGPRCSSCPLVDRCRFARRNRLGPDESGVVHLKSVEP
jgi:DNA (cytosine-5)-methyltransferase 1